MLNFTEDETLKAIFNALSKILTFGSTGENVIYGSYGKASYIQFSYGLQMVWESLQNKVTKILYRPSEILGLGKRKFGVLLLLHIDRLALIVKSKRKKVRSLIFQMINNVRPSLWESNLNSAVTPPLVSHVILGNRQVPWSHHLEFNHGRNMEPISMTEIIM